MIRTCRSCGSRALAPVVDLGPMPLVNALLTEHNLARPEPRYPLALVRCAACTLVQITETVPPEQLFGDYPYLSSTSSTMVGHVRELAERMMGEEQLDDGSLVVEIASNDGYLLQHYVAAGVPVLGIEPAKNIALAARAKGIPTRSEFFGQELGEALSSEGISADVVHAHNVLAHVPDPNGFVDGLRLVLADDGVAVIEVPHLLPLIDRCEFDTIYHEHVFYYSLTSLHHLFIRHGMVITHAEKTAIHGGSLLLFVKHAKKARTGETTLDLLAEESAWGVGRGDRYAGFEERIRAMGNALGTMIDAVRARGETVAAYGASAKGCILLNAFGIDCATLDFVADKNELKQGKYMPGVHLPVRAPSSLLGEMPDYVVILSWNFADEIVDQQMEYLERGGKFIIPSPTPRVISATPSSARMRGAPAISESDEIAA